MPTGVALRDPRTQLFAAAERVIARDGVSGLTSRAVTEEAGVAKGVLHRHFADLDDFLAQLILDRVTRLEQEAAGLESSVGTADLVPTLAGALTRIFTPTARGLIALLSTRDGLRSRLREADPRGGVPLLTEAQAMLSSYLDAERRAGRLVPQADPDTLALSLIGTGHLLFAGEPGVLPDVDALEAVVESIVVGAVPALSAPQPLGTTSAGSGEPG